MRVVFAFQLRHLPDDVDAAIASRLGDGAAAPAPRDVGRPAPTGS
jgi:hypothetical protein